MRTQYYFVLAALLASATLGVELNSMVIPQELCVVPPCAAGEMSKTLCDEYHYDTFCPNCNCVGEEHCRQTREPDYAGIDEFYCSKVVAGSNCQDYILGDTQSGAYTVLGWLVCCDDAEKPPFASSSVNRERGCAPPQPPPQPGPEPKRLVFVLSGVAGVIALAGLLSGKHGGK